jgi:hypothetical protein
MLYGVGDVEIGAFDFRFFKSLIKNSSGRPNKRQTFAVFFIAGLLSNQNDARVRRAFSEYRLGRVAVQIATLAAFRRAA